MKKIPLRNVQGRTRGYALIDDTDYKRVSRMRWHMVPRKYATYAMGSYKDGQTGKWKRIFLHRFILKARPGLVVDHINHNGLDNRRKNIRACSSSENIINSKIKKSNTSGFRGVCWDTHNKRWRAEITAKNKQIYIGIFKDKESAAKAYNSFAIKLHGKYAKINKI